MSRILFLEDSSSYLMTSLQAKLKERGHQVLGSRFDVTEMSKIDGDLSAIVVYLDDDVVSKEKEMVYLKDIAAESDIPIFSIGDPDQLEYIAAHVPTYLLKENFTRPINVNSLLDSLDRFLKTTEQTKKKKILVVDDSPEMLRSIKEWLSGKYQVILASSGMMAIKFLVLNKPDLILLDYDMPVIDGRQVLEMIRNEMDFENVPVIFLTGKGDRESVTKVLSLKPEGYLLKSMSPDLIVQNIDEFFIKQKMQEMNN